MLSWRTKNRPCSINMWDTVTKVLPLYSVYQEPSYEPNVTLLAPFPTEFAYARNVRMGSYDGAWRTECNGITFVNVSKILMKWEAFFIRRDNIWQAIGSTTRVRMALWQCIQMTLLTSSHIWLVKPVTSYPGGRKIELILSISTIYTHKCATIVFSIPGAIIWA